MVTGRSRRGACAHARESVHLDVRGEVATKTEVHLTTHENFLSFNWQIKAEKFAVFRVGDWLWTGGRANEMSRFRPVVVHVYYLSMSKRETSIYYLFPYVCIILSCSL